MKKLKNLDKAIAELNAPRFDEYDNTYRDSPFKFTYREGESCWGTPVLEVFDENENYYIDYAEECACLAADAAEEFGFDYEYDDTDHILEKLNNAIKADWGNDHYFDWENSVILSTYLEN